VIRGAVQGVFLEEAPRAATWLPNSTNTLAEMMIKAAATASGQNKIVLSGGCFQNRYLIERAMSGCARKAFTRIVPQRETARALQILSKHSLSGAVRIAQVLEKPRGMVAIKGR
jgi:hydrogenase maturation factor HypF (carbamoyltransferase family)